MCISIQVSKGVCIFPANCLEHIGSSSEVAPTHHIFYCPAYECDRERTQSGLNSMSSDSNFPIRCNLMLVNLNIVKNLLHVTRIN